MGLFAAAASELRSKTPHGASCIVLPGRHVAVVLGRMVGLEKPCSVTESEEDSGVGTFGTCAAMPGWLWLSRGERGSKRCSLSYCLHAAREPLVHTSTLEAKQLNNENQ